MEFSQKEVTVVCSYKMEGNVSTMCHNIMSNVHNYDNSTGTNYLYIINETIFATDFLFEYGIEHLGIQSVVNISAILESNVCADVKKVSLN